MIERWQVLDLLSALVEKSLVIYEQDEIGQGRYRLLETVRQYGRDRLLETGESGTFRDQHRDLFVTLAEQTEPKLHGPDQIKALNRLETEHDNLRAALTYSHDAAEGRAAELRLVGALFWFWHMHTYFSEGRERLAQALARPPGAAANDVAEIRMRARALQGAGQLAFYQNDYEAARSLLEQSKSLWQKVDDRWGHAYALVYLGSAIAQKEGGPSAARVLEECVALARSEGDPWLLAMALWILGTHTLFGGDDRAARPLLEESAALFRKVGDRWGLAGPLAYMGMAAQKQKDYPAARALIEESVALCRAIGDKWRCGAVLQMAGQVALSEGDYDRAAALFQESLTLLQDTGSTNSLAAAHLHVGHAARLTGRYSQAHTHYRQCLALYQERDHRQGVAQAMEAFARLASAQQQMRRGAHLFGSAEALGELTDTSVPAEERNDHEGCVALVRAALGDEAFSAHWSAGRALTPEQAVEYALSSAEEEPS